MKRTQFPLSTDQLELLIAFCEQKSLSKLASHFAKDPSVVSRGLQRLHETAPVLDKVDGRWQSTALGESVAQEARRFRADLVARLGKRPPSDAKLKAPGLLVVNAQAALHAPGLGPRSNASAERNIETLLQRFRGARLPVLHVRHVSDNPASPFHPSQPGFGYIPALGPIAGEPGMTKTKADAFSGTELEKHLNAAKIETLVLVGFTANECIDQTARAAAAREIDVVVAGDATATYELRGPDGTLHAAERVHALTLANLHTHVAKVLGLEDLLPKLPE